LILEPGSGAGRFTEIACMTGAMVFSFEYSQAIEANLENNGILENLHLFQGDIYKIPLKTGIFDKIFCFGVLQHTPNVKKAFFSMVPYLKQGGELVIDVYKKSFLSLLHWKYLLRPLTKRMNKKVLYKIVEKVVPVMMPWSDTARKIAGKAGARLFPIISYGSFDMPENLKRDWSILDTFDMYSPAYDNPQTLSSIKRWFEQSGFHSVKVFYGPNGIVGKGTKS